MHSHPDETNRPGGLWAPSPGAATFDPGKIQVPSKSQSQNPRPSPVRTERREGGAPASGAAVVTSFRARMTQTSTPAAAAQTARGDGREFETGSKAAMSPIPPQPDAAVAPSSSYRAEEALTETRFKALLAALAQSPHGVDGVTALTLKGPVSEATLRGIFPRKGEPLLFKNLVAVDLSQVQVVLEAVEVKLAPANDSLCKDAAHVDVTLAVDNQEPPAVERILSSTCHSMFGTRELAFLAVPAGGKTDPRTQEICVGKFSMNNLRLYEDKSRTQRVYLNAALVEAGFFDVDSHPIKELLKRDHGVILATQYRSLLNIVKEYVGPPVVPQLPPTAELEHAHVDPQKKSNLGGSTGALLMNATMENSKENIQVVVKGLKPGQDPQQVYCEYLYLTAADAVAKQLGCNIPPTVLQKINGVPALVQALVPGTPLAEALTGQANVDVLLLERVAALLPLSVLLHETDLAGLRQNNMRVLNNADGRPALDRGTLQLYKYDGGAAIQFSASGKIRTFDGPSALEALKFFAGKDWVGMKSINQQGIGWLTKVLPMETQNETICTAFTQAQQRWDEREFPALPKSLQASELNNVLRARHAVMCDFAAYLATQSAAYFPSAQTPAQFVCDCIDGFHGRPISILLPPKPGS